MPYRETLQLGAPELRAKNKVVDDFKSTAVRSVIEDLVDTMRHNELIGMAAPQIGENYKIFVTEPRQTIHRTADQADELRVYINPRIVELSEETSVIYEGCGSVARATVFGPVERPKVVTIEAFDIDGKSFRLHADGILGRVIQHEYDHLEGVDFLEKVADIKQLVDVDVYKTQIRTSQIQLQNSHISLKELL